jgi:hypothetical protein
MNIQQRDLQRMRRRLIKIAMNQEQKITYESLSLELFETSYTRGGDVYRDRFNRMLFLTSGWEWDNFRPMLTSLVVRGDSDEVGDGFQSMNIRLTGNSIDPQIERSRCRRFWSVPDNVTRFANDHPLIEFTNWFDVSLI